MLFTVSFLSYYAYDSLLSEYFSYNKITGEEHKGFSSLQDWIVFYDHPYHPIVDDIISLYISRNTEDSLDTCFNCGYKTYSKHISKCILCGDYYDSLGIAHVAKHYGVFDDVKESVSKKENTDRFSEYEIFKANILEE